MRKLSVFILVLAATFTSCSSDDDAPAISEGNLIGKWQWTASEENGEAVTLDECDKMDTIEFQKDGVINSNTFFTNTTVNGNQTIVTCEEDFSGSGKWSLSGDVLTSTFGNQSGTVKIIELTSTTIKLEDVDEFTNDEGNIVKEVYIDTYTKI